MKKIVLVFALLILGGAAFVFNHASASTETKNKTVILRVTSVNPKEEISFDASYVFGEKNPRLIQAQQKTPFEIRVDAKLINGVFQKTAGEGYLQVKVSTVDEKSETQLLSGSSDSIIIVTQQPQYSEKSNKWEDQVSVQAYDKQ